MKTLEEVIREIAARGELNYLQVGTDNTGKKFRASYVWASSSGCSYGDDADPVTAIRKAVEGAKEKMKSKTRRKVEKPKGRNEEDEDMDFG